MTQSVRAENGFAYGVVGADIHVFGDGVPVYLLQRWRPPPATDDTFLREVPSRMLNARFALVPFTGRAGELTTLRTWRDEGVRMAVRWLFASGGQGKTRLADHFASESQKAGWRVVTATHGPGSVLPPPGSQDLATDADGPGILLVVDYADRWPLSHLLWLFSNALLHRGGIPARVLLLARSDDTWPAVRAALANLQAGTSSQFLSPLPDGTPADAETAEEVDDAGQLPPRAEMFAAARQSFADRYGVPADHIQPPADLTGEEFGLVLALHLAALVAVDAHVAGRRPPPNLSGLTCYLLDREHLHWARLHGDGGHELDPSARTYTTPPDTMNRAVFAAALTGPLPPAQGHTVLTSLRLGLPESRVLADHGVCYPPADRHVVTVLEPLYPDRLSEDFLALTLPGHHADYPAQPWAGLTAATVLTTTAPAWTPRAVTFLAAAAQRWPHVGPRHLYPLLATAPHLAVAAGSAALTALADLDDIPSELLEAVASHFPSFEGPHTDLDPGIAAVSTRLLPHQLANIDEQDELPATVRRAEQGSLKHEHGIRLFHAGRLEEALAAAEASLLDYQALDLRDLPPSVAEIAIHNHTLALTAYGTRLSALGRRAEALAATQEAITRLRTLAARDPKYRPDLASALFESARNLHRADRWQEATATMRECVTLRRELAATDTTAYEGDLATALQALGMCLEHTGQLAERMPLLRESVTIQRRLARASPATHTPSLANALASLARGLWQSGDRESVAVAQEAAALLRPLADANPAAYTDDLAVVLTGLGTWMLYAGQRVEALSAFHESVALLRRISEQRPAAHALALADALASLSVLLVATGHHAEAIDAADEAVTQVRHMAVVDPDYQPRLALFLCLAAGNRAEAGGPRLDEAVTLLVEARTTLRGSDGDLPTKLRHSYQNVAERLVQQLIADGREADSDQIRDTLACDPPTEGTTGRWL